MKIMLITGGSRGIGAATALLAAANGYAVALNYKSNKAAADNIVNEIKSKGGHAIAIQADISLEAEVVRLFETTDRQLGTLDCLVNNAGILEKQTRVEDITADRLNRIFAANITGQIICAREAIRRMSTKHGGKGGTIINVSSIAARLGAPDEYVDYAASKGAIDTFAIGLSKEVAAEGIRVNAVRPGLIYTDIHADGGEPGRVDRLKAALPMKRGGQPEEIAEAIYWLASEKSSYATGTFIDLGGGR
jgi:NAD(P)-dependent dehydrogenase (short-subunit alcohol dehydrogenase family)